MTSLVTIREAGVASLLKTPSILEPDVFTELAVPIDWILHVGGVLRVALDQVLNSFEKRRKLRLSLVMREDPVVDYELKTWLHERLSLENAGNLDPVVRWAQDSPKNKDAEFSEVMASARDYEWISSFSDNLILDFLSDMKKADVDLWEPPWVFWSRLPGWLIHRGRRKDVDVEITFELETRLAFVRSALSPQDEVIEAERIGAVQIMVNPTFEIVERPKAISTDVQSSSSPLLAFCRQGDRVMHRPLAKLEAAILDQCREAFRPLRGALRGTVAREFGVHPEFVEASIDELILNGMLLGRLSDGGSVQ